MPVGADEPLDAVESALTAYFADRRRGPGPQPTTMRAATREDLAQRAKVSARTITRWMREVPGCPIGHAVNDAFAERADAWIAAVLSRSP